MMADATPETASERARETFGPGLLKSTLIVALVLAGGFLLSLFVPPLMMIVVFLTFDIDYLWAYTGVPVAVGVFVLGWFAGRKILQKKRHRLQLATQLSAIGFVGVGTWLAATSLCIGGQASLMTGYWLHAKFWLDTDGVRQWAQNLDIPDDFTSSNMYGEPIADDQWPPSLQMMGDHLRVYVCQTPLKVTLEQGSPLVGHWGVYITAKDQDWTGEGRDCAIKKLEDGAWIWSTPD